VIELPRVAPVARRLLAEVGACERVEVVAADVVAGPPPGAYDAAMLVRFTQVLSAEENRRALRHVAETLAPGGAIYILAVVVDDTRTAPEAAVRADLLLLNLYDHGRAYTEGEYRAWLAEAGFAGIERTIVGADSSLLGARKEG
jgi:hypothetical protein